MARYEGRHRTAQTETTQTRRGPVDRPARSSDSARPNAWGTGPSASNLERAASNRRESGRPRANSWHSRPHDEDWDHEAAAAPLEALAPQRDASDLRREQAQREQAQREQAQREQAQREQAQREQAQREQAQREQAQREQAQREAAWREQLERERGQREAAQRAQAQREAAWLEAARLEQAQREQAQREAAQREAAQREAAQREAAQREAAQREAAQREAAQREAAQREQAERDTAERDAAQRTQEATAHHRSAERHGPGRHEQPSHHDHQRGRHREIAAHHEAADHPVPKGPGVSASAPSRQTRRSMRPPKKRNVARPVLASTLALGLGASGFAYAKSANLIGADTAAFVVGSGVVAQTDELARAATVDTTYRAAASVSRNERRTAIAATGLRTAKELEAKKKAEAARKAAEAREAERRAELERERKRAIANARNDPKSAARVLMLDHGWTSDAQYNCLVNLWTGESGWRWNAENSSSGAYGIPQSLPASKMGQFGSDYRTNPITQIQWGLWYIEQSYGNPCNAWSTWQARSPHWY
ncbi:hypothetical protein GCM10027053_34550 [Intrasporangium mesophilum]